MQIVSSETICMKYQIWFSREKKKICLCWSFMAQSTQWGHVERSQFT